MPTARNPRQTLADDATIDAGIAADPDAREWTDQDMAQGPPGG